MSGGRWRCASCEKFVSIQDLEVCGLTKELINDEFKRDLIRKPDRDRVQYCEDGSYALLPEASKRGASGDANTGSRKRQKQAASASDNVIDLL